MKKLLVVIALWPGIALSDGFQVKPGNAATPRAFPTPGTPMERANVDIYGNQQVVMVAPGGDTSFSPYGTAANTWQSCSVSNVGVTDVVIKAAGGAGVRIYVTSISCFNTAAVASSMAFKDGATQIYVGAVGNSTLDGVAYYAHALPVPLRTTTNTAFNFAMGTTATATTCCAVGYTSTN